MKIKYENVVICSNYNCSLNCEGACMRIVVALDGNGKCTMCKPQVYVKTDAPGQIKHDAIFNAEASKRGLFSFYNLKFL